jgi:hypothetical protein
VSDDVSRLNMNKFRHVAEPSTHFRLRLFRWRAPLYKPYGLQTSDAHISVKSQRISMGFEMFEPAERPLLIGQQNLRRAVIGEIGENAKYLAKHVACTQGMTSPMKSLMTSKIHRSAHLHLKVTVSCERIAYSDESACIWWLFSRL